MGRLLHEYCPLEGALGVFLESNLIKAITQLHNSKISRLNNYTITHDFKNHNSRRRANQ